MDAAIKASVPKPIGDPTADGMLEDWNRPESEPSYISITGVVFVCNPFILCREEGRDMCYESDKDLDNNKSLHSRCHKHL